MVSWDARVKEFRKQGREPPEGSSPAFISLLKSRRIDMHNSTFANAKESSIGMPSQGAGDIGSDFGGILTSQPMPEDYTAGMTPMDWDYWNDLLQVEETTLDNTTFPMETWLTELSVV